MATFPLPFIPGAPEGNNIVQTSPDVPLDPEVQVTIDNSQTAINQTLPSNNQPASTTQEVDPFANTQFSTSFRPQTEVTAETFSVTSSQISPTNLAPANTSQEVDPFANTQFSTSFRPQATLAENTAGLPVLAEDGSVAQGVAINPETGEIYSTEPPALTENLNGIPVLAEDGSVAQGVAINPETGEIYSTGSPNPPVEAGTQEARTSQTVKLNNVQITGRLVPDSRVRLQLAKGAKYLYNDLNPGILKPLQETNGVIFPYTPQIQLSYQANYESTDLTHTNYKIFNYKNSNVSDVTISAKFTAQDQKEAAYLLAVIHFFRSVTKMFYGLDKNPIAGTPPPLCYLTGYGTYMFDELPLVVNTFQLSLPADVDYINAGSMVGGEPGFTPYSPPMKNQGSSFYRLRSAGLQPGANPAPPSFSQTNESDVNTRVPTILDINITCHPIITRKDMSNKFSLKDYASGNLLRASSNGMGRGVW